MKSSNPKKIACLVRDLEKAAQALKDEKLSRAETLCRKVLKVHANQPDALHMLGLVCSKGGNQAGAIEYITRAIRQQGGMAEFHYHLAELLRVSGEFVKAIRAYHSAIELKPDYVEALFGLGSASMLSGRIEQAISALNSGLEYRPDDIEALCDLGEALSRIGQFQQAVVLYKKALGINPAHWQARVLLGNALAQINDIDGALNCLREAVHLNNGQIDVHNALTKILLDAGRVDEALAHFDQLLMVKPDLAEAHVGRGICLQQLGRLEESIACHRAALGIAPALASAHFYLVLSNEYDEGTAGCLAKQLASQNIPVQDRMLYEFALAKTLDAQGSFAQAFEHCQRANGLKSRNAYFNIVQFEQTVDGLIEFFSREFFNRRRGFGVASELPVLVVGMPRSGTTLVEQVLAAHSGVHGAGELNYLASLVEHLPEKLGVEDVFPRCLEFADEGQIFSIGDEYLNRLKMHAPLANRIVDKMPSNYLRLGLYALLFPQARVIYCQRDPFDTALSCYLQNFEMMSDFTTDLSVLGRVYAACLRLMDHWHQVLPIPILDLRYEELVEDVESSGRQLIAHCGLSWEPGCLDFHRHERQIRTSSFWQVRQPVYNTSIGRSHSYKQWLAPFAEALDKRESDSV